MLLHIRGSRDVIAAREPDASLPMLSIIVPARNEERQIERCVRSLLAQRYPNFEVIVVDDESSDATPRILSRIAAEDTRLRVVPGEPLPQGWVGKPWALAQGERIARGAWMLCTDADTVHEPFAASSAVQAAQDRGADAFSLLTLQETKSLAERALLPSILWVIIVAVGPLDAINDPRKPAAMFNGQYLLLSRALYEATGGHELVANEIAEDLELARRLKSAGRFRINVAWTDLVSTRMYRSFGEIWSGFVKNFWIGVRERTTERVAGFVGLVLVSPVTPLLAIALFASRQWALAAIVLASLASTTAVAEVGMRRARFPAGSGLWFPAALSLLPAILATSVVRGACGGIEWRGRRYRGVLHGS